MNKREYDSLRDAVECLIVAVSALNNNRPYAEVSTLVRVASKAVRGSAALVENTQFPTHVILDEEGDGA